jgi:hypothetical protein
MDREIRWPPPWWNARRQAFVVRPFPSIYLRQWSRTYAYRCPACSSDQFSGSHEYVDERHTLALTPRIFDRRSPILHYQRYVRLICEQCGYLFHIRPEGLWYESPLPIEWKGGVVLKSVPYNPDDAPDAPTATTGEETRLRVCTPHESEDDRERMKDLQAKFPWITNRPKPLFTVCGKNPMPVARPQDLKIFDLAAMKRYADYELNPRITHSRTIVLTGAGFSASLGFPTMNDFKACLPSWVSETLGAWLGASPFLEYAWNDFEILVELLLRLQRIAALAASTSAFLESVKTMMHSVESLFVFQESSRVPWACYPPLAHVGVPATLAQCTRTSHFRQVREMLHAVTKAMVLQTHRPSQEQLEATGVKYHAFLNSLAECNGGPLPLFTTNFDRVVEDIYKHAADESRVVTGVRRASMRPVLLRTRDRDGGIRSVQAKVQGAPFDASAFAELKQGQDVLLFRMHGCSSWFINRLTTETIEMTVDNNEDLGGAFDLFWRGLEPWVPGIIAPATVKDAYTIAPPFNLAYDYFAEGLKKARIAIIIGQRLRDETLKEMLFWSAQANPTLRYVVVGRDGQASPHVQDAIPADRLTYFASGFPDASDAILDFCQRSV